MMERLSNRNLFPVQIDELPINRHESLAKRLANNEKEYEREIEENGNDDHSENR